MCVGDRAATERCLRIVDRALQERGYDGRPRHRFQDDGVGPMRLVALSRSRGRFTVGLNLVPRGLVRAFDAVDSPLIRDLHDRGDTANLGFWERVFTLADRYDPQGGWREVRSRDEAESVAAEVTDLFDSFAEPWFSSLSDGRSAVAALRGWTTNDGLPMEAAILLDEPPSLRCIEVAEGLELQAQTQTPDLFYDPEMSPEAAEIVTAVVTGTRDVNRWLAAQLRQHAIDLNVTSAQDKPLEWPAQEQGFYKSREQIHDEYKQAWDEGLEAVGIRLIDPNHLPHLRSPRRSSAKRNQKTS